MEVPQEDCGISYGTYKSRAFVCMLLFWVHKRHATHEQVTGRQLEVCWKYAGKAGPMLDEFDPDIAGSFLFKVSISERV